MSTEDAKLSTAFYELEQKISSWTYHQTELDTTHKRYKKLEYTLVRKNQTISKLEASKEKLEADLKANLSRKYLEPSLAGLLDLRKSEFKRLWDKNIRKLNRSSDNLSKLAEVHMLAVTTLDGLRKDLEDAVVQRRAFDAGATNLGPKSKLDQVFDEAKRECLNAQNVFTRYGAKMMHFVEKVSAASEVLDDLKRDEQELVKVLGKEAKFRDEQKKEKEDKDIERWTRVGKAARTNLYHAAGLEQ